MYIVYDCCFLILYGSVGSALFVLVVTTIFEIEIAVCRKWEEIDATYKGTFINDVRFWEGWGCQAKSDKGVGSLAKIGRPIILGFLQFFFASLFTNFFA